MKVIGITGGIGSGKSLVTRRLKEQYQAQILNTDEIAKRQMEVGGSSYEGVVNYFGKEILEKDGSINRKKLGSIVFEDKAKLKKLNELTHPQVRIAVQREIGRWREKGTLPYLVIETALMIESGFDSLCDEVWYVHSSEEERRERLKVTRNYSDDKIRAIFSSQSKEEEFFQRFQKVIFNDGSIARIEEQVKQLIGD